MNNPAQTVIHEIAKFLAEYDSQFGTITVEVQDVDEDHRAYCINPAGNMEYPFVSELKNIRAVTEG